MTTEQCEATVNGILNSLGQPTLSIPASGTDDERLLNLFEAYAEVLRTAVPAYRSITDRTMIPDAVVHMLTVEMRSRKLI